MFCSYMWLRANILYMYIYFFIMYHVQVYASILYLPETKKVKNMKAYGFIFISLMFCIARLQIAFAFCINRTINAWRR